jgi:gliding motility-associated-like protein
MRRFQIVILILITIHCSLFTVQCFAQQQAWNWYFDLNAALNFSSGTPVAVAGCSMNQAEGNATVSDASGNLLFYTDGISVWNRNNAQMPNGFGLNGNWSTTQSALIVPKPDSPNIYYIFTLDSQAGPNGFCYSIVDMTLDAGLGDVTIKNTQLLTPAAEKQTAVRHCNGIDFWVIVHGATDSSFYSYLVSNSGIAAPVISNVGIAYTNFSGFHGEDAGYLKASQNGKKLAVAIPGDIDTAQVFDFDNSTGLITNPISLPFALISAIYGVSFSPDNLKLYVMQENNTTIYQYDLSSNNQSTIIASQYIVANSGMDAGSLQLGSDNKIYISQYNLPYLNCINNPNVLGAGCNYVVNAVSLGAGAGSYGTPNMIDAYFASPPATNISVDTIYCAVTYLLSPTYTGTSYLWSTGATTDTISISANGTYWVQIQGTSGCNVQVNFMDTFHITLIPPVIVSFGPDTTAICSDSILILNANNPGSSFNWSTGATTQTINVSTPGSYTVTVTSNNGCAGIASQTVIVNPSPAPFITGDSLFCSGDSSLLDAGSFAQYNWSTGASTETITVNATNNYIVTVTNSFGCTGTASKIVTVNLTPTASFTADTLTGCSPLTVTFNNNSSNAASYLWNFGNTATSVATSPSYNYDSSGIYTVTLIAYSSAGCTDTMVRQNLITILGLPVVSSSFTADTQKGCSPFTVRFINTSGTDSSYLWNFGDGSPADTAKNPTHTFLDSGSYTITLITTNTNDCGTATDTAIYTDYISVNVFNPVAAFTSNYTIPIYTGDSIHFQDESYDLYGSINLWQWWFGDGTGTNFENPIHQWDVPGIYQVELIVTDNKGCKDSTIYDYIDVIEGIIEIPNIFSPNNDGYNDFFEIKASGIETFQLDIFNRWGMKLFTSNSINIQWDGYNENGLQCPDGTYYYVLKATGYTGTAYNRAGFVMLLR